MRAAPPRLREDDDEEPLAGERDAAFYEYVEEFRELVTDLTSRREHWLTKAPPDDPMRYDEVAFRELELVVLTDFTDRRATTDILKAAHRVSARKVYKPSITLAGARREMGPLLSSLQGQVEAMTKTTSI